MPSAEPIRDEELAALFANTLTYPAALAVSGGADSVALMHLVRRWMRRAEVPSKLPDGRDSVVVVTVDHGLRPQSAEDARRVTEQARRLGYRAATLKWEGEKPRTGIQEAARSERYRLLQSFVVEEAGEPRSLVTAHHQDDQAETLLMRLARGSGIDGLAGMRPRSEAHGLVVVRPLLGMPKARLLVTLEAAGETWIEDPSNESEKFERVRWRNAQPALAALGLTSESVALSARRLARARDALERAADEFGRPCAP
jgi:tRNA(Ile)-lysidine synthetase, N-terminal domain